MLTLMKISRGTYSIVQYTVSETAIAAGKQVKDLTLPEQAVIIALYQGEKTLIPHGDTMVGKGDIVLAFADEAAQQKLNQLFK